MGLQSRGAICPRLLPPLRGTPFRHPSKTRRFARFPLRRCDRALADTLVAASQLTQSRTRSRLGTANELTRWESEAGASDEDLGPTLPPRPLTLASPYWNARYQFLSLPQAPRPSIRERRRPTDPEASHARRRAIVVTGVKFTAHQASFFTAYSVGAATGFHCSPSRYSTCHETGNRQAPRPVSSNQ